MRRSKLNQNQLLLIMLALLVLSRVFFLGKGFLAFPDEWRFVNSIKALELVSNGDFNGFWQQIFLTQGRPGDALIKLIPAAVIFLSHHFFATQLYGSFAANTMFVCNFIIYVLILNYLYRIAAKLLVDKGLALVATVLFSCFTISFISLRHADPYDASLLLFLVVFSKILNDIESPHSPFFLGFLSFFAYLIYPGNILIFLILFGFYCVKDFNIQSRKRLLVKGSLFGLGTVSLLLITEVLSRLGGKSFLRESFWLSTSILQGSFSESYSFIFKYFFEVEGFFGLSFLFLSLSGMVLIAVNGTKITSGKSLRILMLLASVLFLTYSSAGYFFGKVVWYARLLKQFVPFLILFALVPITVLPEEWRRRLVISFLLLGVISYGLSWNAYRTLSYPLDALKAFKSEHPSTSVIQLSEYAHFILFDSTPNASNAQFLLVNIGIVYPFNNVSDFKPYHPKPNEALILNKPDCVNFRAYQFEGYNIHERENIRSIAPTFKVYEVRREPK